VSPWQKNVCFGFNSTIVRPSPAFARKAAESNGVLLLLVKMPPRYRPFVLGGLFMPRKASPLRATFGDCGEWIKGRERSARGNKGHLSLCDLTPATQARLSSWGTCAKWEKHPVINRNYDQSLSIMARSQRGRLVYIAHFEKSSGGPAKFSAARWAPPFSLPPFRGTPCRNLPVGVRLG